MYEAHDNLKGDALRRQELANFLRARREDVQPEDVGLVRQPRRRVRGLRRHEVADLAFVSVTWYTWLEQGRDIRVSVPLLDAVARALRLDDDAWRYIRRLAGAPVLDSRPARLDVDESLVALLEELQPSPAVVTTLSFEFVAWNQAYVALFLDQDEIPEARHNGLWRLFMSQTLKERLPNWEAEAEAVVTRVRAEYGKNPDDERLREVIDQLMEASEAFRAAWQRPQVSRFTEQIMAVDHPEVGRVDLRQQLLRPLGHPGLLVNVYIPSEPESRKRMMQLLDAQPAGAPSVVLPALDQSKDEPAD